MIQVHHLRLRLFSGIFTVLLGIIYAPVVLSQEIIDDFEDTPFPWTTVFGTPTPTASQNSTISVSGSSSLELSVSNFPNDGFGAGTTREFSPALDGSRFTSISYWLQSNTSDSVRTVAIQLIDNNGVTITQQVDQQLSLSDVLNTWVQVTLPLDLVTGFEGPANFDITNVTRVGIILFRNSGSSGTRSIFIDDITFAGDPPSKPMVTDLIDEFSPPGQYNENNRNDIGGFTDDDATMGVGNTNDRINDDGILSLTWNNDTDFWFTVLNESGADISENGYLQLRMRGAVGGEEITAVLRNSGNFTSELDIPTSSVRTEFTTINLALPDFSPTPILNSMKSLTLTFPDTPTGSAEIDQVVFSAHPRPNTIVITPLTSTTFENGQTIQLQIDLQDENGQPLNDFTNTISLEVANGAIDPPEIGGFDQNGGSVTETFTVSASNGTQAITIQDALVNVSNELAITLTPSDDQEVDRFDVEIPSEPVQFWGAFFPITITARNSEGVLVDTIGQIDITSDIGNLVLLDNGQEVSSINMTENPLTVQAYLKNPIDDDLATATVTVELISERTKRGTGSASFKNAVSTDGEVDFFITQQDGETGLVTTVFNTQSPDDTAHVYTNALAIILFVHKGILADDPDPLFLTRAEDILTTFQGLQIGSGTNAGGFFDAYDANDGSPRAVTTDVTSGNNAWLLMAINYYTTYTNNTTFVNMAVNLGKFLQSRQINTNQPGTAFNDVGGIFSREGDTQTFVTEHQAESFSGLFYLSQLQGVDPADASSFSTSAEAVRLFMMTVLFNSGRFDVAGGRSENTALDAQTSAFLGLPGPIVNDGTADRDISSALDFVFTNIFKQHAYPNTNPDRIVEGPTFRELDPNPDCGAEQFVWIEGAGQLALALGVLIDSNIGSSADAENRNNVLENMNKVRDPSSGFPTHLGNQLDCADLDMDEVEDETQSVGSDEISVVPAAWSYFNKVDPILNPYVLESVLSVKQDNVFIPGDGSTQVTITATLRQAGSVANEDIQFDFDMGNGTLGGLSAPNSITETTNDAGEAMIIYTAGSTSDIARITVSPVNINPVVVGGTVFVLQDFADNFEKGIEAGGTYTSFGSDIGSFGLEDGSTQPELVNNGSFSGKLETDEDGFNTNRFIGISKSFTVTPIDVSVSNVVAYWVRGDGEPNPPSVQIEFVMMDNTVWSQKESVELTSTYERISRGLDESEFDQTSGSGAFDKSMIKSMNLLLTANDNDPGGTQRILYVDDIIFFTNPRTLELSQSVVYVPANGTATVTITATVLDNGNPPGAEVNLLFSILNPAATGGAVFNESSATTHSVTTEGGIGQATCTYRAGEASAMVEVLVEEQ